MDFEVKDHLPTGRGAGAHGLYGLFGTRTGYHRPLISQVTAARRRMDFEMKDHLQLGAALGLMDFEAGSAVSGTKFTYLRGAGALLEVLSESSPPTPIPTILIRCPAPISPRLHLLARRRRSAGGEVAQYFPSLTLLLAGQGGFLSSPARAMHQ